MSLSCTSAFPTCLPFSVSYTDVGTLCASRLSSRIRPKKKTFLVWLSVECIAVHVEWSGQLLSRLVVLPFGSRLQVPQVFCCSFVLLSLHARMDGPTRQAELSSKFSSCWTFFVPSFRSFSKRICRSKFRSIWLPH